MPAFDFPTNPTNGQFYTANGITFMYNATLTIWEVTHISNVQTINPELATTGKAIAMAIVFG
jgi:hypothetical protein